MIPVLPTSAPFSPEQRAWLNGFLSGVFGLAGAPAGAENLPTLNSPQAGGTAAASAGESAEEEFDAPWHDPVLEIDARMELAKDRPIRQKMMAAMAQQDCGQCGYLCKTYSLALANGTEKDPNRCTPGGKPTSRKLKQLLADGLASGELGTSNVTVVTESKPGSDEPYHREQPFPARLKETLPLTADGAEKQTQSVVFSLAGSGLSYLPGDSLGVFPENDPALVEHILKVFHASGLEPVSLIDGTILSSREALSRGCNVHVPSDELLAFLGEQAEDARHGDVLKKMAAGELDPKDLGIFDLYDLLLQFPTARPPLDYLIHKLDKLQPRLYSIASSPNAHPDEVHLCVSVVKYQLGDRVRKGVSSTYLSERVAPGSRIGVYLQRAHEFRLPADPRKPVIMVGPGTGIAPFRAFLEERHLQAQSASGEVGKNWLFFGAQKESTDFLYRDQLADLQAKGTLTRLSTAFSRDQSEKIYVQTRMMEQKEDLWRWIKDEGAHFYVCGDAQRMAADVDQTLVKIAADQGNMSHEEAASFVAGLAKDGRYLRDVY